MGNQKEDLWTVLRMLEWATDYFKKEEIPDPRLSIEWLLADVLSCKRLDLYLSYERPLSPTELDQLRPMIKRRASHEPLQYIIGYTDFMNCRIEVNPSVLIPRIETEQLVELLLDMTASRHHEALKLLDIGTGSGCIPIAIKHKVPVWNCSGMDISREALKCAKKNSELNNFEVAFFEGDLFKSDHPGIAGDDWDIIISNPPYIQSGERTAIQKQVSKFEPKNALFHENPTEVYQSITEFASTHNASLFLELNDRLAPEIFDVVNSMYKRVKLHKDLDNNPRFISAFPDR
ncbi:peptide chain release factor N(5)-glutamine methyltransferase [soil metagenome]